MIEVGAQEAENTLSALLDRVERGEEVRITRHGRKVARLVPDLPQHDVDEARAALARISAMAKEAKAGPFNWEEWKAYRDEGRR
jgi:prevent-host-death family protein